MTPEANPICFLCFPDAKLVVRRQSKLFAMVGLGPLSAAYCIAASSGHDRSLADLYLRDPAAIDALLDYRNAVEAVYGTMLMSEHGRVPICREDGDDHEQHCFHAHALLFRMDGQIEAQAAQYYSDAAVFTELKSALAHAAQHEHYLMVSPNAHRYTIFSNPLNAPRQLVRTLVAISLGQPQQADWRTSPRYDDALRMASEMSNMMEERDE